MKISMEQILKYETQYTADMKYLRECPETLFETWRHGKEKRVVARDGYSARVLSSGASVKENSGDRQVSIWACQKSRTRFETSRRQGDMYCSYGY